MALITLGRTFYPGFRLPLTIEPFDHFHDNKAIGERYRIVLLLAGSGVLTVNERNYPIVAPSLYCLNEKDRLAQEADFGGKTLSVYFHPRVINSRLDFEDIDAEVLDATDRQDIWLLDPFLQRNSDYNGCLLIDPSVARHAEQIIQDMQQALAEQKDTDWPCRSRSYLMELLFLSRRVYQNLSAPLQEIPNASRDTASQIIHYLHVHYREKLKVDELAKLFHTNKTTLNLLVRMVTGLSLISYLNTIRMQIACSILRNTRLPISEIMERVGYRDDAHFNRNFRKFTGCSPSEFRKRSH